MYKFIVFLYDFLINATKKKTIQFWKKMRYFEMASISIRCIDWLLVFCNMHTLLMNIDHNHK